FPTRRSSDLIISELHGFDRVFAVRPLANGWRGETPQNWFEVQDWTTEMWFSVGYKAEVDALKRINDLIAAGVITDPKYRRVDLVEIQPETPAGYFNYFVERGEEIGRASCRERVETSRVAAGAKKKARLVKGDRDLLRG